MKKLLFWVLLAIAQPLVAQNVKDLVFKGDLDRVNARIDSLKKAIGSGVVTPPVTPPPSKKACPQGPEIRRIFEVANTGASVEFHGEGVDTLQYELWSGATRIKTDLIAPKRAIVEIAYPAQPDGTYQLVIRGQSCKSKEDSKKDFPIARSSGGVVDPTPEEPTGGVITPGVFPLIGMTRGYDEHLNLVFRDSANVRLATDIAPDNRQDPDRYMYRYMINGDKLDLNSRLKNYVVAGNNPLRVLVGKLKKEYSAEGFNKWAGTPEEYKSDWFKIDAGESFSGGLSYAFQTYVAKGAQDAAGFLNHIPQNYDPSDQQVSWAEIGEDIKLPNGHFWAADWKPWGVDRVFAKGVTHLPHHSLPWNDADSNQQVRLLKFAGKTFSNFQRIEGVFGRLNNGSTELWPNGTSKAVWPTADGLPVDEAREWAWKTDASDAIWLSEMSENVGWQPAGSPMFGAFYPELRKRYEQDFGSRGIHYEICHNYFWQGGESLVFNQSAEYYKKLFRTEPKDLPSTEYSPGGTLSATTMIVEAVYLRAPDQVLRQPIELAFRLEYFKHMGYHAGVALFGQGETRPNNRYRIDFPDGTYFKEDKFPLDPNVHIASAFFSQVYGNFYAEWGGFGKANQKLFDGRPGQGLVGEWYPKGSSEARNNEFNKYWPGSGDIYHGFTGSADLSYFGIRLYAKTFGQTDGGDRAYLRHRIDGGEWITPSNFKADELVDAYKQQRGFVYSQTLAGKTGWFYHNSFADNNWHTLDVQLPNGQIVSQKVAGNGIHAKLQ
ncbi:hypothetical protein SAMN04487996_12273 [Dyadobacter soli]|uniref:Uncharacterized protein n=1 Tax=Dyadobacter soli TaxID=659014 RepID=A0A1G7WK03_9BACT|nr:hypothetical protein [Dyadobacter soli]SDG72188.1 hypothetical protein SAMN04487996_12273 [Dyadobacter soli]